jgi:DNA repair exonuclease SbcCD ATPase subunit
MRKAFETNVPRLKPRLRTAGPVESAEPAALAPVAVAEPVAAAAAPVESPAPVVEVPAASRAARPSPFDSGPAAQGLRSGRTEKRERTVAVPESAAEPPPSDVPSRRDRLEKIKRKVAEAARPAPRHDPVPADPARAAESVLALVGDLEAEVSRAREREEALRADLDGARGELARAAGEARSATERLAQAEQELSEKRGVLSELLAEMEALEQERDESVRRAQALATIDEERAKLLEDVSRRAEEEARLRADRETEVERLGEELRTSAADGARLRAAVGELARERDQLAGELDRVRGERDELAAAKRALEQVHAALSQARAKLG